MWKLVSLVVMANSTRPVDATESKKKLVSTFHAPRMVHKLYIYFGVYIDLCVKHRITSIKPIRLMYRVRRRDNDLYT